mmetsp:Transcript_31053/g.43513  ORF Transcript_31053/g.43513 Transcript_31053/m.43513 type:complete len:121 (+) Transcript_31053:115-477(+)
MLPDSAKKIIFVFFFAFIEQCAASNASDICWCKCCSMENECEQITFPVNGCGGSCDKGVCKERFPERCDVTEISALCVERDSIWTKAMVLTFIVVAAMLLTVALLSRYISPLKRVVAIFR